MMRKKIELVLFRYLPSIAGFSEQFPQDMPIKLKIDMLYHLTNSF